MYQSRDVHLGTDVTNMAISDDVEMVDATTKVQDPNDYSGLLKTNHSDAFAFSAAEELALRLYDQLREFELQQSLLQVQQSSMLCTVSFTW
jgi:hypothetical protein